MILIMSFDFLINLTDVYIAGKISKEVQASVGFVSQIYFIFIVIANALSIGAVSVISRLFASGNRRLLEDSVYTLTVVSGISGVLLGVSGILLSPLVIGLLAVPDALKTAGIPLVQIYAGGLVFHYLLIITNAVLRSTKMLLHSVITMGAICLLNIGLNFYFVFCTPLGFLGIAMSTACSVAVGCGINLYHLKKSFTGKHLFSISVLKRITSIGWPSGLLQIAWQTGSAVLFLIVGSLPQRNIETLAALTNGLRIEAAIFLPAFALNQANAVIIGNMLGEKRYHDVFRSGLSTAFLGVLIITILTIIVIINAVGLAGLLSDNGAVIEECVRYLYISMISEPFMAWAVILGGGLNGAGDTRGVMRIVIFSQWAVRLPLGYLLGITLSLGASAIWWSMNSSIFVHAIIITIRYFRRRWIYHE